MSPTLVQAGLGQRQAFKPHTSRTTSGSRPAATLRRQCSLRCQATSQASSRREALQQGLLASLATALTLTGPAVAAEASAEAQICDAQCVAGLDSLETVTTPSGLQYKDIVVGKGSSPPVGFQVVVNYVAMTPAGRVFDSSLEKGKVYDIRVGAGQVVAGLDEGLLSMKTGGVRRLYIPGSLSFPKGLKAAAGRPTVPPASPVVFDVQLLYIPGLEDDE